jgi:Fe-coproporphyrin III synthase
MNDVIHILPADHIRPALHALAAHRVSSMPVVVIAMHEACDCRCVMCDIWKIREPQAIAISNLQQQMESFHSLGVRWVVFTGGEPQRHAHFVEFANGLKSRGIRVTVLTAGLELEADAHRIASAVDDLIVSLDGPPPIHNEIRRVPHAFERMMAGLDAVRKARPTIPTRARCTVQSANHRSLCSTVECAKQNGLASISFLAADVSSAAFNRPSPWKAARQNTIALNPSQVSALEDEVESLIAVHGGGDFVVETPEKLRRIVLHYRAHLGQVPPISPRCNAPWVSAVIEAGGQVRPCFFHAAIGNIHQQPLAEVVNSLAGLRFRSELDVSTNPTCRRCVCALHIPRA